MPSGSADLVPPLAAGSRPFPARRTGLFLQQRLHPCLHVFHRLGKFTAAFVAVVEMMVAGDEADVEAKIPAE